MGYNRTVTIHVDGGGLLGELDRLIDGFTNADLAAFDSILTAQFLATKREVHVISGSLTRSAKYDSTTLEEGMWQGHIQYGGMHEVAIPSSWNRPSERGWVDYAPYEQRRVVPMQNKHVQHNFLKPAVEMADDLYVRAIRAFVEG